VQWICHSAVNIIVQWTCSLFQTLFGERGIVLCLFNLTFVVQLDTRFTSPDMGCILCCVFYLLYCSATLYYSMLLFSFCVFYCLFFVYCTVSCDIRAATLTEVFPCFFLSCKANARVQLAKKGHGPHFPIFFIVMCV
jgi:hypothetical protein